MKKLEKEFYDYATKHQNISGLAMHNFTASLTPMIVEERPMNVAIMSVFDRMLINRIVFLGTPLIEHVGNIIQAQLLFLESLDAKRDIRIFLNSPGGSCTTLFQILDTMLIIKPDIEITNTAMAASAAAVLLSSGTKGKRKALKHARTMIHQISGGVQGTSADIEIAFNEMKKYKEELYTIIAENTGQTYDKVNQDADRDYWMTAQEAKDYGMIDIVLDKKK